MSLSSGLDWKLSLENEEGQEHWIFAFPTLPANRYGRMYYSVGRKFPDDIRTAYENIYVDIKNPVHVCGGRLFVH